MSENADHPPEDDGGFIDDSRRRRRRQTVSTECGPGLWSCIRNQAKLLSPTTWWSMIQIEFRKRQKTSKRQISPLETKPPSFFSVSSLVRKVLAIAIPSIFYQASYHLLLLNQQEAPAPVLAGGGDVAPQAPPQPWNLPHPQDVLGPWAAAVVAWTASDIPRAAFNDIIQYGALSQRSKTLQEAKDILYERMQNKRAYRTHKYDVYLPPPSADGSNVDNDSSSTTSIARRSTTDTPLSSSTEVILMIPERTVETVAYARTASLLSDAGYAVLVLSTEPLRIPYANLPNFITEEFIKSVRFNFEHHHGIDGGDKSTSYTILGHSVGALAALQLASLLSKSPTSPVSVSRVVLWGIPPVFEMMDDYRSATFSALVLQSTQDYHAMLNQPSTRDYFWKHVPLKQARTELRIVEGGTHDGFASYELPKKSSSPVEGPASISLHSETMSLSRQEQQEIAVELTVQFLRFGSKGMKVLD